MDGFRVFLRGCVDIDDIVVALEMLRPVEVLDGPVGAVDVLGVRDAVFVELHRQHQEEDWYGLPVSDFPMLVRFLDAEQRAAMGRAWVAAHSFLWMVTLRCEIDEALLVGPDTEPLRFRDGRIRPALASEERYLED